MLARMKIVVELELDNPYELTPEEIEKDICMAEDKIGWNYYYKIKNIEVIEGHLINSFIVS